jgi:TolB protein
MQRGLSLIALVWLSLVLPYVSAEEDSKIFIDVGKAQVKKSQMALPPLTYIGTQGSNASHLQAGQNLFRVMLNDLSVSNFFTFIPASAFLEDTNKVGIKPAPGAANGFKFENWKPLGTEFLVRGAYQVVGGDLSLEIYVYHVPTAKQVLGKLYKGPSSETRRIAHSFANDLMLALTGKRGIYFTKIVASRQEPGVNSPKEIYVMDWDGANAKKITSHHSVAISPAWSNKGDKIAYTAFAYHKVQKTRNADMFLFDLNTGKRLMVSYKKGINSGANFLPGDNSLLLTISQEGSPDIFKVSVDGTNMHPITKGPNRAMNVEPAVSPDGKSIAFSSDRAGRPMIFIMGIDGSGVRRITFAGKYNASPSWSPDGKTLAFAGFDKDHFDIFTIGADGTGLKRLTDARKASGKPSDNESPSWSPDGRNILFNSNRTGHQQLYIISPDGTNERRVTQDNTNWEKPKWSPYLD